MKLLRFSHKNEKGRPFGVFQCECGAIKTLNLYDGKRSIRCLACHVEKIRKFRHLNYARRHHETEFELIPYEFARLLADVWAALTSASSVRDWFLCCCNSLDFIANYGKENR